MAFTLNALAVGLGAVYPNFREDNPSKIVSGFGGTLCLVLSFLYIIGMLSLMAATSRWAFGGSSAVIFGLGWALFLGGSFLLGWLPLRARHPQNGQRGNLAAWPSAGQSLAGAPVDEF